MGWFSRDATFLGRFWARWSSSRGGDSRQNRGRTSSLHSTITGRSRSLWNHEKLRGIWEKYLRLLQKPLEDTCCQMLWVHIICEVFHRLSSIVVSSGIFRYHWIIFSKGMWICFCHACLIVINLIGLRNIQHSCLWVLINTQVGGQGHYTRETHNARETIWC